MSKIITRVFLILGSVVLGVLVWSLVLGSDGLFTRIYNKAVDKVNVENASINGGSATIVPDWNESEDGSANSLVVK